MHKSAIQTNLTFLTIGGEGVCHLMVYYSPNLSKDLGFPSVTTDFE